MLCVLFFLIGYGYAYKDAVEYANVFVNENCNNCFKINATSPKQWEYTPMHFNVSGVIPQS